MTKVRIIPAILSGGSGERLWPLSTGARPKQFRAFTGVHTLFQDTAERLRGAHGTLEFSAPIVLCNALHQTLASQQLQEIGARPALLVLEPIGRNTAAAAVIAAALAKEIEPGALVLLAPADHMIADAAAFRAAVGRAAATARERIVTFGVKPTRAETGYGYIEGGDPIAAGVFAIRRFHEKPDAEKAAQYQASGVHFWNSGMFLFDPDVLIREFAAAADIRDGALLALAAAARENGVIAPPEALFARIRAAPIDKAVMEKTARGAVAPCDMGWADLGSWAEVWRLSPHDEHDNSIVGDAIVLEGERNLIRSDGPRVALAGVSDLVVVVAGGAILIVPRERAQDVKKLLELVKAREGAAE
jgi:mannose-1-phosphate guanylyltransferase/mannose-6-phosphate isomerase